MPERSLPGEFTKGVFEQNAVFVLAVGLCPTLAVTTSLQNAVAMGVAVIFVLVCANAMVALLRHVIPPEVRIPCFIVIIGSFVTMVEIVFKGKLPPELNASLGIFIPLIVVNCIILYRAESFAYKNGVLRSVLDGLGIGLGYTLALCLVAGIREVLGSGTIWGYPWLPTSWAVRYVPASILIQAPGAFLVLGLLLGFFNWLRMRRSSA
ncbi:MAG: electron transport complex subunit RsxE [Candidatus Brocadiaceae bacterium]|nr:electron transport complex subunit RsxE [Candidatus Brocadiaceae bacterium]